MTVPTRLLDATIHPVTRAALHADVDAAVRTRRPLRLVSVNMHWLYLLSADADLRRDAVLFDRALVDGTLVQWAVGRRRGAPAEKHAGSDLVVEMCSRSARDGLRLFFLGAAPGVAAAAAAAARARHPGCSVVGTASPPPEVVDDEAASRRVCDDVNASGADVLFVAFGMPRQERWLIRHDADLDVPVRMGVGASLDFLSGRVRRAPAVVQRAGLESMWRLAIEPRRLWRRYLVQDPVVAVRAFREAFAPAARTTAPRP